MPITAPLHIHAFQQAIAPAALGRIRPVAQQDALAVHTHTTCQVWQDHRAVFDGCAPHASAWVSVADGVSSSPCAALASRSLLQVLHTGAAFPTTAGELPGRVRQMRHDWQARHLRPRTQGAACTLASVLYVQGQLCAVNCGDSRIWRLRPQADGSVQWLQLSRDHTVWQQMLDAGEVQPEEADRYASVYQGLSHCLVLDAGDDEEDEASADPWLHIWHGQAAPGDCYLLATDGLHDTLPAAQLQALWQGDRPAAANLAALHAAYQRAGAPDDISVVALCVPMGASMHG